MRLRSCHPLAKSKTEEILSLGSAALQSLSYVTGAMSGSLFRFLVVPHGKATAVPDRELCLRTLELKGTDQ